MPSGMGTAVMAASAVALNIDNFCFVAIDAVGQAVISFARQSYGTGDLKRVDKIFWYSLGVRCVLGVLAGGIAILFVRQILGIYTKDPEVVRSSGGEAGVSFRS